MFTLTTPVGQTSGRCITQLAKMSIDPKIMELTADVFYKFFFNISLMNLRAPFTYVQLYGSWKCVFTVRGVVHSKIGRS